MCISHHLTVFKCTISLSSLWCMPSSNQKPAMPSNQSPAMASSTLPIPQKDNTVPPCTKVLGKSSTLKPLLPLMHITDLLQLPAMSIHCSDLSATTADIHLLYLRQKSHDHSITAYSLGKPLTSPGFVKVGACLEMVCFMSSILKLPHEG